MKKPNDVEALVSDEPDGAKMELRLWLRLLACSTLIETEVRRRLRSEFKMTLPQFDVLAQLYREHEGLRLTALSRRMMVSNGNLTGLIDRLVEENLVLREADAMDGRATMVRLTRAGRASFGVMAKAHEAWIHEFCARLSSQDVSNLLSGLQKLKKSVLNVVETREPSR